MVFEFEPAESVVLFKKGGPVDDFGAENRHFSTRASCFRQLWASKKVSKNACFVDSIVFQAGFERLRKLIKSLNLTRASRFRLILTHQKNIKKTSFLSTASCFRPVLRGCEIGTIAEFDESFAFQADFDPSKTVKKRCFCRQHRVSGLF